MEDWLGNTSDSYVANNVRISNFLVEQVSSLFKGHIFVGGLFCSQIDWPKGHLALGAGGLPSLKKQWLKVFPDNEAVNLQLNVDLGKSSDLAPMSKLFVFQHHRMGWKDWPTDGRYFSAKCRFSEPMFETIKTSAIKGKTTHSDCLENVIILPMPHACEPDETSFASPKPLRTQKPISLSQVLIGHLSEDNQTITSISICEEDVKYYEQSISGTKSRRWWRRR